MGSPGRDTRMRCSNSTFSSRATLGILMNSELVNVYGNGLMGTGSNGALFLEQLDDDSLRSLA